MRPMICLAFLVLAGCADKQNSESLVERLRILAIRAEPPEATLDQVVELNALIADPAGQGRALSSTWVVCSPEVLSSGSGSSCPGSGSYPLETDGTSASLSLPELVGWFEDQGYSLDLATKDITLLVGLEVRAQDESIMAVKRLKVQIQAGAPANRNPDIEGLELDGALIVGQPTALETGSLHTLRPRVGPESQEWFLPDKQSKEKLEDNAFSWFSTGGTFSDRRTILDTDTRGKRLEDNQWTLPDEAGLHRLWVVVRDGRYGTDWLELQFDVGLHR